MNLMNDRFKSSTLNLSFLTLFATLTYMFCYKKSLFIFFTDLTLNFKRELSSYPTIKANLRWFFTHISSLCEGENIIILIIFISVFVSRKNSLQTSFTTCFAFYMTSILKMISREPRPD